MNLSTAWAGRAKRLRATVDRVTELLAGVPGTSLVGLYGMPFLRLDDVLARFADLRALAAIHDEVCLALAQVPLEYTGGSHRSMGIMPPSRAHEAGKDYGEVIRALDDEGYETLCSLADDADVFRQGGREVGEERETPLTRRQMLWLEKRHGVYFPWKAYVELIPNRYWGEKSSSQGKTWNRLARTFFPKTVAFVDRLPFEGVGRCNVMGLAANDHGTVHRDGWPDEQAAPDEFITLAPVPGKRLFIWDEDRRAAVSVEGRAVWFNDFDFHGVEPDPFFRYSIRVDGVFTHEFREAIRGFATHEEGDAR